MVRSSVLAAIVLALAPACSQAQPAGEAAATTPAAFRTKVFNLPAGSHPHDAAPGPAGQIWYTAQQQGALGIIDIASGKVRQVPLGPNSAPHGVIQAKDGTAWITDGFFSRPGAWPTLSGRISPDGVAVAREFTRLGITRLAAVVPVHAHYDHALDAPLVAVRSGAQLIGSSSAIEAGRGFGLPEAALREVRPGDTMKRAPALRLASRSASCRTVPAPTIAPFTIAISRIASSATGVRNVTSSARRPPATSASAIGRASATFSITSTGITGASLMMASMPVIVPVPRQRRRQRRTVQAEDA